MALMTTSQAPRKAPLMIPPDLFRRFAAAKTEAQQAKFAARYVDFMNEEATERDRERGPADLDAEREAIRRAVGFLTLVSKAVEDPSRVVRRFAGFRPATMENYISSSTDAELIASLARDVNAGLDRSTVARLSADGKTLAAAPRDLVGVMWLQLAEVVRALAAGRREAVCSHCGSRFTPGRRYAKPKGGEELRVFCSSKCRMQAFYARRKS